MIHKCRFPGGKRHIWIPALLFLSGLTLCLLNFFGVFKFFQLPELFCMTYAATWESCIQIGLVPSNHDYRGFFSASTIAAQITDESGSVRYRAKGAAQMDEVRRPLDPNAAVTPDENKRLNEHRISGGHVHWLSDLSAINRMRDELVETRALLTEEAELTRAENELREQRSRVEEQSRLYDRIAMSVRPQLTKLDELLAQLERDLPKQRCKLRQVCIVGAYIKRRCNLQIIAESADVVPGRELYHCLRESLEYVSTSETHCPCIQEGDGLVPSAAILLAYDFFQAALEAALPSLSSMLVRNGTRNGGLELRMVLEDAAGRLDADWRRDKIARLDGTLDASEQDGTLFYTLRLCQGGAAA